jgi:hypothetical protein
VYTPKGLYAESPVSTGQPGHPTPEGIFTILSKELYHRSNLYSGAPMPFMQRITYTGVAMHEGVLPGYAASHGCIRLPREFAKRMFQITAGNERVVIAQRDVAPVEIAHPRLPAPKFMAPGQQEAAASGAAQMVQNAVTEALNPVEYAKVMKAAAARQAVEAAAAVAPAREAADLKARSAREAALAHRKAETALAAAKEKFEAADRNVQRAAGEVAMGAAAAAKDAAEARLNEARAAFERAAEIKTQRDQEAESAARAAREADASRRSAADAIKTWNRRFAPLSIFISRKTKRLYVRQDYVEVFDTPIAIREPEKPFGTHLFIAMPKEAASGVPEKGLRWLALSLPAKAPGEGDVAAGRWGGRVNVAAPVQAAAPAPSASEVLDRIEIPEEAAAKLSGMVWAGAGLIVTDNDLSHETTDFARTDFVVVTGGHSSSSGRRPYRSWRGERPYRRGGDWGFFGFFD